MRLKSKYKIDRFAFAGSFGKRTNIAQSDADCVFFVNNQEPPFDEVLKEFDRICNQPAIKKSFHTFTIELKKNSIKFHIDGLDIDVVVATNLVNNCKQNHSLPNAQQKEALKRIKLNPVENCYKYSSALTEASVLFMRERNGFSNDMARIAKYWFQSLDREFKHISGASTFIELVAVHATKRKIMKKARRNNYLKAFVVFLELLKNFDELDVSFGSCIGHSPIAKTLPRVIDPVNPYNNFAEYWCESRMDIDIIKDRSAATLQQIHDLVSIPTADEGEMIKYLFGQ